MSGIDGFNPTHRVANMNDAEWESPKNGEQLELREYGTPASLYRSTTGRIWWLNDEYVEAISTTPTIVKGKRYRIEFVCEQDDYVGYVSDYEHITVEELPDPLPTAPGSVVRDGGEVYVRIAFTGGFSWQNVTEPRFQVADSDIEGRAVVLFDANETGK